jgi:TonB family protein
VTFLVSLAAGVLVNAVILAGSAGAAQKASLMTTPRTMSLCAALQSVDRGQELRLVVSGVYVVDFETQILLDPNQVSCDEDVQPRTWVEFAEGVESPPLLTKLLHEKHRAYVTLEGTLFGPPPLEPDDLRLPDKWSASYRLRGTGYGHMNAFRTKMVVNRVDAAARVPESMLVGAERSPSSPLHRATDLLHADLPTYPYGARLAGLEGEVEVEVTLKDGKVVGTRVIAAGDRALAAAAVENIQTWRFSPDISETFTTRFVYVLDRRFGQLSSQKIELDIPTLVRITAPRNGW